MTEFSGYTAEILNDLKKAHAEATRGGWSPTPWFLDDLMMRLAWVAAGRNKHIDAALDDLRQAGYIFTDGKDEMFRPEVPEETMVMTPDLLAKVAAFGAHARRMGAEEVVRLPDQSPAEGYFDLPGNRDWARPPSPRPSFDQLGMETAKLWATRSSDEKLKVGACALSNDSHTLVGVGYNGRYPGAKNESRVSADVGGSEFLHSEQNLLVRARWEHGEKHTLYVTHEPCHECALLILAARHINRVVYQQEYIGDGKRRRGSEILREAGVEVVAWQDR